MERQIRESNIHNVLEIKDDDWTKRKEGGIDFFNQLCKGPLEIEDMEIKDIFRLGGRTTNKQSGKRPMKVIWGGGVV